MTKAEQGLIDAYEQNKHLDHLLSDRDWLDHTITNLILADLWVVVKAYAEEKAQ